MTRKPYKPRKPRGQNSSTLKRPQPRADQAFSYRPPRSGLERLIDASVKCVKCGVQGVGNCDCWGPK
jgi:hypothetical protein